MTTKPEKNDSHQSGGVQPRRVVRRHSRSRLFLKHKGVSIYLTMTPGVRTKVRANWLSVRAESNAFAYYPGTVFAPTGLKTWKDVSLNPKRAKDLNGNYYDTGYRYGHESDFIEAAKEACRRAIDAGHITRGHAPEDAL